MNTPGTETPPSPLRAVILAAGPGYRDGEPYLKALDLLDQRAIVDYVLDAAARNVPPQATILVVGFQKDKLQAHQIGRAHV